MDWVIGFSIFVAILVVTCVRCGPCRALGATVALSFLFPAWIQLNVLGFPLNLRTTAAIIGLLLFCVHPRTKLLGHFVLLDFGMMFLVLLHVLSDVYQGEFVPRVFLRAYGEWVLPYVAGRYALRSREDLLFLIPVMAAVGAMLGAAGVIETFTGQNVFEPVFGLRPLDRVPRGLSRLGWKRAYATTLHPNYFGGLMILFVPWVVTCVARTRTLWGRIGSSLALLLVTAGTLSTLARGAAVTLLAFPVTWRALSSRRWAVAIGASVVALGALAIYRINDVSRVLHWAAGEKESSTKSIELDGKRVGYTSTGTHFFVIKLYGPLIGQVGPFGVGTDATSTFPPRVPGLPESEAAKKIWMVDNGFILIGLRFGWLGLAAFIFIAFCAAWQFFTARSLQDLSVFATTMAATCLIYCGLLMTVWMSYDFGFVYLWTIGLSSAMLAPGFTDRIDRRVAPPASLLDAWK